ncbi:MAG: 6,7-dimethyl-8-ribityllumazine synthase [Candidatus Omnitrophica bacterium]|nr:6,7-dimethyl-8-ribityllumazine synthase [Candidatus Omnitrophota bacterium]
MGTRPSARPVPRARVRRGVGNIVLVASRFNASIMRALVAGARRTLARHGVPASRIRSVWVPGAFELPLAALTIAKRDKPQAVIALGCVIKGETPQYAAIGQAVAEGLTQVALATETPVTCGVIVADSFAQAKARAGGRVGNRGAEAALAALAMVDLLHARFRRSS